MTVRPRAPTVISVVGARPNFMKLAPVAWQLARHEDVRHLIIHTGQHYDVAMSDTFFSGLDIPDPDCTLGVGSGSHAVQTAAIMQRFEPVCLEAEPDLVLVYGDVNSTVGAALVAAKLGIPVAHVEAGLRSRDRSMPEEINRVVTDQIADILFTPSRDADENLLREGVPPEKIHFVGNVMIDSLVRVLPAAKAFNAACKLGLEQREYAVVTLHRPSNVDNPETLKELVHTLAILSAEWPVCFAVHPRTEQRIKSLECEVPRGVRMLPPLPYVEMLSLVLSAGAVITDSGGLQEETSFLGIPCVTVRPNTERPVTLSAGTNSLVASSRNAILPAARAALGVNVRRRVDIELWDGRAAERIVDTVKKVSRNRDTNR